MLKKIVLIFFISIIIICNLPNYSRATTFSATAPAVILFNSNTGKVLFEKNGYQIKYPASTTKIMTAILTIENCNLEDTVVVSDTAVVLPFGYVGASLQPGETLSINNLLHLLLLSSANDAANVLAEHIGGSVADFASIMNAKAKEIGCLNTNFVNPNGIHDGNNHYSTAYDLCLIADFAMKNDTFKKIVSTATYTVPATNKSEERILKNTNIFLHKYLSNETLNPYYYEFATGIKTGYTTVAKSCLVASASKNNIDLICVILEGNENENASYSERYEDARNLFETTFNNYSLHTVKSANDKITTSEIQNTHFLLKNLDLVLESNVDFLVENENLTNEFKPEILLYEDALTAPIKKGDVLGTVTYTYNGTTVTRNLLASHYVPTAEMVDLFFMIILCIILFVAFYMFVRKLRKKKKNYRIKKWGR